MSEPVAIPGSGEDRLIARHFRPLARHPGTFGLMDDAAALTPPPGCDLILTTDGIISGVHVFSDEAPDIIARRALRVNLSDLAAKGASPAGFLLSIALPAATGDAWIAAFASGLDEDAERYACPLLGGDTDKTPGPLSVSIAAFGSLPTGTMVRRKGARAGDVLFVSGTIGDAALGLILRKDPGMSAKLPQTARAHLLGRYRLPEPRTALAEVVRAHASAAMDVSDGLVGDLAKLCRASGVSVQVAVDAIPLSEAAREMLAQKPDLLETALTGGDDYEILATVSAANAASFRAAAEAAGVPVTEIGRMESGDSAPQFVDANKTPLAFKQSSYTHF